MSNNGVTYTQSVYTCSRKTASVSVDNTEWINEFAQGIKLKKGDQVRLLGSFVQEGSNSEEIEIDEELELNISYSPYILGNTLDTIDKTDSGNLIDMAQIGDLCYSTDAYGIEPPSRKTTQKGNLIYNWNNNDTFGGAGAPYPEVDGDVPALAQNTPGGVNKGYAAYTNQPLKNPVATGETGGTVYGSWQYGPFFVNGGSMGTLPNYVGGVNFETERPTCRGDSSVTWGTNLLTDTFDVEGKNQRAIDYSNFANSNVPTEMYVGNMVKKFILPVLDFFETGNTNADPTGANAKANWDANATAHQLEDLLDDAPASGQAGCLAGVPKVGMYISTVDLAQSSGWYDDQGRGYYECEWGDGSSVANFPGTESNFKTGGPYRFGGSSGNTGIPNLKAGVQSVVGRIVAVRPIKHHVLGVTTPCYEIYVTDFVNPAALIGTDTISHTFPVGHVTRAEDFANNTDPIKLYKIPHGAGELPNGYSFNPSYNGINGADNSQPGAVSQRGADGTAEGPGQANSSQLNTSTGLGGYKTGDNSGTPTRQNYLSNRLTESPGPVKVNSVQTGGDYPNASQINMGLGNPQGLSFLWNGTHTGSRKVSFNISNADRYRANSWAEAYRKAPVFRALRYKHLVQDITYEWRGAVGAGVEGYFNRNPVSRAQGTVPVALGGYIIAPKETMMDIIKGNLSGTGANNFYAQAGRTPRVWFDLGFQARQSDYSLRHYVGNSFDTYNAQSAPNNGDGDWTGRFPGNSSYVDEKRFGYTWLGRPNNQHWRRSIQNNGTGRLTGQTIDYNFEAGGYYASANTFGADGIAPIAREMNPDGLPIYFSTQQGQYGGQSANNQYRGAPFVFAGYNNTVNSIHFQQKETGDINLGLGSWRARTTVQVADTTAGTSTIRISSTLLDVDGGPNRVLPIFNNGFGLYQIKVLMDDCQFNPVELVGQTVDNGDGTITITLLQLQKVIPAGTAPAAQTIDWSTPTFLENIPQGTSLIVYFRSSGGIGVGLDAQPWASDMVMIKENIMKLKVPAGFYSEERLADILNDVVHNDTTKYAEEYGNELNNNPETIAVPCNVGKTETARPSRPSLVQGNFVQSYIPDINYGFTPITNDNAVALAQRPQTKEMTSEVFTYDVLRAGGVLVHYWAEDLNTARPYNGTTTRRLTDFDVAAGITTELGQHFKLYSIPYVDKVNQDKEELCLVRMRGGALARDDFDTANGRWRNVEPRWCGQLEMLAAYDIVKLDAPDEADGNPMWSSFNPTYAYKSRLTRNLFPNGGSCRVFCGANNFTISYEGESVQRFSLNNLYTPIRPHEVETDDPTGPQDDFGVGDAIPSAIICSKADGKLVASLTGIYINDLNAGAFTANNWGQQPIGTFYLYDTDTDADILTKGYKFLSTLGYTQAQADDNNNSFNIVNTPFTFKDDLFKFGQAIRVVAKITPAINASNPVASRCLNIAPVQQFFVQVATDDFFAQNVAKKGDDPYYLVGSDLPAGTFYGGNIAGSKINILGFCSRNFSARNFVFDLGGSSVNTTIPEDVTVSSIRTKIYNSNMTSPTNLSDSSSVIYIITRYNYLNNLTPQQGQIQMENTILQEQAPVLDMFNNPALAGIRTSAPPFNPGKYYYTGFGDQTPINSLDMIPEEDEDSD